MSFNPSKNRHQVIGRTVTLHDMLQGVVQLHLIVEVIHFSLVDIVSIQAGIIDLCQKERLGIGAFDV